MTLLREEILNRLETREDSRIQSTNAAHDEQHIQNSNTDSPYEFEPCSEKEQGAPSRRHPAPANLELKAFPLALVMKACPDIADYGPGGAISSWRELMAAAVVVRATLGVSPSAYQEACAVMGAEQAAVAMACILERASFISSPGGYLRDLTRRAEGGAFSLGPMLMALLKGRDAQSLKVG